MSGVTKKLISASGGVAGGFTAIEDVFSCFLYTGNGSSQVIENGIRLGQSFGSGSAEFAGNGDYLSIAATSQLDLSGDFSLEARLFIKDTTAGFKRVFNNIPGTTPSGFFYLYTNGTNLHAYNVDAGTLVNIGSFTGNSWFHFAVSRSGSTTRVFVNGTQTHSYSGTTTFTNYGWFIGGGPDIEFTKGYIFDHRVVVGTALYTANFTPPTSALTAIAGTVLLTCQGADPFVDNSPNAFTITQNGNPQAATFGPFDGAEAGEGGLVWAKSRGAANSHILTDTVRGAASTLSTNSNVAQNAVESNSLSSFNSNGFSLNASARINALNDPTVSWTFRKAPRFFDVVTWTGDGTSSMTIPHSLGSDVGSIFIKRTNASEPWWVVHRSVGDFTGYGSLDTTAAFASNSGVTSVTDSSFTVDGYYSNSDKTYVAYLFAHDPLGPSGDGSDGLIDCGSFTVGGSGTDVPTEEIDLGWEPQWVLYKRTDSINIGNAEWRLVDVMRGAPVGANYQKLSANNSDAEAVSSPEYLYPTSTGFNAFFPGNANFPGAGASYIYIAIRRGPMRAPESGTEVFAVVNNPTNPNIPSDILVDSQWFKTKAISEGWFWHDRLRQGSGRLDSSTNDSESSGTFPTYFDMQFDQQTGVSNTGGGFGSNYLAYNFRRAPEFFDVVAYTGNGTAGHTVPHNLGVAPEMIIQKKRSATDNWHVYHRDLTSASFTLYLNHTFDQTDSPTTWNSTAPTDSVFTIGGDGGINATGSTHIAYLFSTLAGVSKVGSYTGNGSSQTINCGFTTGARFILIKRTDSTGDWYVWDTARGIVAGNDPHLSLNTTAAEVTTDDSVDPDSSGFIVNQVAATDVNVNAASYIFYAVA